ncbi:FG-GAP repeat domain-containing protein [Streptomyces sp. NBC_00328]|uniref:FG-GAP repeat domain-containing protein n=1 Tax=Streptomyces sp. NBC_00328 TaxID=2903646 RepID=UPI002E2C6D90|nr:VCBS repeat-containing protein [Streptomyces sp. NBC_00328]
MYRPFAFEKWIDKAGGQFSYIAESSPTNDMVRGSDYLDGGSDGEIAGHPASGYFGLRYVNIAGGSKTGHDFTGDGVDDVAGVTADGVLRIYRNNAGSLSGDDVGPGWTAMDKVAAGDFNGDGDADIVATNGSTGELFLYLGNGGGGFESTTKIGSGWTGISQMAAGDFTGDGKADIVAANNTTGDLNLYTSNGSGISSTTKIGSNWGGITKLTLSDIDNDGKDDVVAISGSTGDLLQYTSTGTSLKSGVEIGHGWSTMQHLI